MTYVNGDPREQPAIMYVPSPLIGQSIRMSLTLAWQHAHGVSMFNDGT